MKPKNLIILSCDELRGDCTGYSGNPDVRTPHLDRLAARSTNLANHFSAHGKCVPSRISLITGRYPHTDGFRTITGHLPDDQPNLFKHLRELNYETALLGHPHITDGFWGDNSVASGTTHYHSYTNGIMSALLQNERPVPPATPQSRPFVEIGDGPENRYGTRRCGALTGFCDENRADQAIHYLETVRDRSKPFFLQLNFGAPHPKYCIEEPYHSMYDPNRLQAWPHDLTANAPLWMRANREIRTGMHTAPDAFREIQATYYGMITKVDTILGRVLDSLDRQNLWEDSVVLFWSDHGDFAGQYGLYEKWDTALNDCILHTPQLIAAPGLPRGHRVESLTETVDLAPTVLKLLELPPLPGMHGCDLRPVIEGRTSKTAVFADGGHEEEMRRRFAANPTTDLNNGKQLTYYRYPESMARARMIRTDTHKLIVRESGDHEFYDMRQDPWELHNRYGQAGHEATIQSLQLRLLEWCLRTDPDKPYQDFFGA